MELRHHYIKAALTLCSVSIFIVFATFVIVVAVVP